MYCGQYTPWQAAAGRRNQREAQHDRAAFGALARRRHASMGTEQRPASTLQRRATHHGGHAASRASTGTEQPANTLQRRATHHGGHAASRPSGPTPSPSLPPLNESALSACRRDQLRVALGHEIRIGGRERVVRRLRELASSSLAELTNEQQHHLRAYLANLEERITMPPNPRLLREGHCLWLQLHVDVSETMWACLRRLFGHRG